MLLGWEGDYSVGMLALGKIPSLLPHQVTFDRSVMCAMCELCASTCSPFFAITQFVLTWLSQTPPSIFYDQKIVS